MSGQEHKPVPPPGTTYASVTPLPTAMTAAITTPAPHEITDGHGWRNDLKWIFGIPFALLLVALFAVLSLFQATAPGQAEKTITAMSQPVLAEPALQSDLALAYPHLHEFINSPDFALTVYDSPNTFQEEIGTIPDNVDASVSSASPGVDPSQNGVTTPADTSGGLSGPGSSIKAVFNVYSVPLHVLSRGVHSAMGVLLVVLLALSLLTGIPVVFFSRRMGRIVSVGVCLAVASWGPFLVTNLMRGGLNDWLAGSRAQVQGDEQKTMLQAAMRPFVDDVFGQAVSVYRFFSFTALFLLLGTGIIYMVLRMRPGGYPDRRAA